MPQTCLITGATGFVGSHLAEAAAARGFLVRALVRPSADIALLQQLGAELIIGDLGDAASVKEAVAGVDVIFHCAARVGDWGPVDEYRAVNVGGLSTLLDACRGVPLERFVLLSSLGVYPARHHYGTDESERLPRRHVDGYTTSKVEAERLAREHQRRENLPLTILRPGFIYGPRDRTLMPRLVENLRRRVVRYIGSGGLTLNCIYVKNLVEAFVLAVDRPGSLGQAYNLTDGEPVSKQRFIEAVCAGLELPLPSSRPVPYWFASLAARALEWFARSRGAGQAPRLTRARLKFLGLNLDFSIAKAKRELGYQPMYSFDDGMSETLAWFRAHRESLAA